MSNRQTGLLNLGESTDLLDLGSCKEVDTPGVSLIWRYSSFMGAC